MAETTGERLRRLRGEKTQYAVSEDTGISISSISMYENDERVPRDSVKIILARYYKRGVEEIFFPLETL